MPMHAPAHPGELIRDNMAAVGWSIAESAARLDIPPSALDDVLAGRAQVSPRLALALEHVGWSTAEFWMRVQAGHDLADARQRKSAA